MQAQPGDRFHEFRFREFNEIQDSIAQYPSNLLYRWMRIQILFNPTFDLYTAPTGKLEDFVLNRYDLYREKDVDSIYIYVAQPCDMCPHRREKILNPTTQMANFLLSHQQELFDDLNLIIATGKDFNTNPFISPYSKGNNALYYYKRGQWHYVTGQTQKAVEDYHTALTYKPTQEIQQQIYISLSALYFTQTEPTRETLATALKYLDQSGLSTSRYESEKIDLLKYLGESKELIKYLQERSAHFLRLYVNHLNEKPSGEPATSNEYIAFDNYQKYQMMLFDFLKETQTSVSLETIKEQLYIVVDKL